MSRKIWHCADAVTSCSGDMICVSCRQPIMSGEYRVAEKPEAYVVQHRACSADAPEWVHRDLERERNAAYAAELERAARAFYAKWGVADLRDYLTT